MPGQNRREEALRHAEDQRLRIVKQQELIGALERAGQKNLLPEAHRLLAAMMRTRAVLDEELRKALYRPSDD
ncbi:hypothetical protein [Roseomonas populi]|uniref:Uncharacterized protein n=1 Tax=Roseomonas populi TaxID=3121582 RepID=A0ABT1XAQ4_9PROT|nr:hypothetical protein [Roseomonas pecuniae]MCR0985178.1 hypothetical protein [Roseomonas pecuniae]